MNKIYIKRITVYGSVISQIDFVDGLNVIVGPSDTGKTLLLKSIDFVLGSKDRPAFYDNNAKYDSIELEIINNDKKIIMNRNLSSLKCKIDYYDDNGVFERSVEYKDPKKIGNSVLNLIGIDSVQSVPSNKNNIYKELTGRSLKYLWYIDEDDISKDDSILINKDTKRKIDNTVYNMSGIYYLLTGNAFDQKKNNDELSEKQTEAKTILKYLKQEQKLNIEEVEKYKSSVGDYTTSMLNDDLNKISESIKDINTHIEHRITKFNDASLKIIKLQQYIANEGVTIDRYKELISQYDSDIKRIDLILKSNPTKSKTKKVCTCPLCNHVIEKSDNLIDISTLIDEKNRVLKLKENLIHIVDNKEDDIKILKAEKDNLDQTIKEINGELSTIYYPMINKLNSDKDKVVNSIQFANLYDYTLEKSKEIEQKIKEKEEIIKEKIGKFESSLYFDSNFAESIEHEAFDILKKCLGDEVKSVEFNLKNFDLILNGKSKGANNGQGYKSIINCANALAFRKHMCTKGKYSFPFMIIDKPLKEFDDESHHNFKEEVNEDEKGGSRCNASVALFNYLLKNQYNQVIIAENTNRLFNKQELIENGVNVISFSKKYSNVRKGFLLDYVGD